MNLMAPSLLYQNLEDTSNPMAEKSFKKGDKVEWDYADNKVEGEVVEKVTEDTKIKGHEAKASKDDPQYKVKSEKSGKTAIHKAEELEKK